MRILVLGGDGMLGHQVLKQLSPRHQVAVTLRQDKQTYQACGLFDDTNAFFGIDVRSIDRVSEVMAQFRPDAVVNCVGIVKQRPAAMQSILSLEINALLPHRLAVLCRLSGARLVHMSTDCVFSGRKGNYLETDVPDAEDLYGRSKLLGEVADEGCVTLRTSIIGRELSRKTGLLEWALAQRGPVKGYQKAIFSGFTTLEMARIIEMVLQDTTGAHGVFQVSSDPIDKHALLLLIREHLHPAIDVVADSEVRIDRSLDSTRFRKTFGYTPPSWGDMIAELARPGAASAAP
ncbi:dTDP-4-dehydrorhamnose reductase family protein [Hoeflea olei]|uniref:dTDP-4-dehydrorhamnose reductase n=1 Tax=Hoeflea olei TaxID=1480615 RepID=A0A1C1YUA5_9HYPH|nr:SDR family oxidoreductase [Hoeflea olei]OCW57015.1 NAD(P)-dependent oxidoreductase [Hoeflea olei]